MLTKYVLVAVLILELVPSGHCSSLLCGRTKEVEVGENGSVGAALALTLVKPSSMVNSRAPCQLKLSAPDAAAFTVRLIDVKESLGEWERGQSDVEVPAPVAGTSGRKWSSRGGAYAQDTSPDQSATVSNTTDSCKLLIYMSDSNTPIWRLSLCGGNAASIASRAGTKLLPPKLRIVWNPPSTPYHHTEKLRLVVTAVNSGDICNDDSQFTCGYTTLCISSNLVCDGVRHCPGGEDEDFTSCSHRRNPPLLELLRRFAARNQELLAIENLDGSTKPSVIMKISENEQKKNAFMEFAASLKPYAPWSYLVVGMLICATILMFCLAWECCCKSSKPSSTPLGPAAACGGAAEPASSTARAAPPQYEEPPSYASLFPRAFKSSPSPPPQPHCSHDQPPD